MPAKADASVYMIGTINSLNRSSVVVRRAVPFANLAIRLHVPLATLFPAIRNP